MKKNPRTKDSPATIRRKLVRATNRQQPQASGNPATGTTEDTGATTPLGPATTTAAQPVTGLPAQQPAGQDPTPQKHSQADAAEKGPVVTKEQSPARRTGQSGWPRRQRSQQATGNLFTRGPLPRELPERGTPRLVIQTSFGRRDEARRACAVCQTVFASDTPTQVYCSVQCYINKKASRAGGQNRTSAAAGVTI